MNEKTKEQLVQEIADLEQALRFAMNHIKAVGKHHPKCTVNWHAPYGQVCICLLENP
jgi:hypothetical protein